MDQTMDRFKIYPRFDSSASEVKKQPQTGIKQRFIPDCSDGRFDLMKTKPNSGYVLVVVISLLSVLLVMGLAFAGFTIYGLKHTAMIRDNSQAYYAARAGIARAIQTANAGGNKDNSVTFELLPFDSTTSGLHKILVTTRWKPATESILIPGGAPSLEITSMGTVQTGDQIKARRILKAYTDPASGNQRLLSQLDISNAESSLIVAEKP
jgi:hypothetical protein